jgi:hypothetical protein
MLYTLTNALYTLTKLTFEKKLTFYVLSYFTFQKITFYALTKYFKKLAFYISKKVNFLCNFAQVCLDVLQHTCKKLQSTTLRVNEKKLGNMFFYLEWGFTF